ncbi:MAG: hypothetical protein MUF50_03330 [Planctomycetes bacterium]|jgi:aromatic ring-opening dioxygenase LigB subunit|nr:hypothetical protein [Planctomycetota bacterium]
MPLSYTALVPHSPILIPSIGKDNHSLLNKTNEALREIREKLKEKEIETLIIISPHGPNNNNFIINVDNVYNLDFSEFGDFTAKAEIRSELGLAQLIKETINKELPIKLQSPEKNDYASAIPLFLLAQGLQLKSIVINTANTNYAEHFLLGQKLAELFSIQNKKIALIASGDLSHRVKKNSPAGYSPKGVKFDHLILNALTQAHAENELLTLDEKFVTAAGECGLKPILVLLGAISNQNYLPRPLSYQNDFGIGYLTMDFAF